VETIVKIKMPEDMHGALHDGVLLCHLANHLRPHSVSTVHVPSPAVVLACHHSITDLLTLDVIMVTLWNRADHYIFILWFLSFIYLSSFFSSPNLSRGRLDVCHTSTHGGPSANLNAGLKHAARGSLEMQDAKIAILAPSHNFVGLYLRN